MNDVSERPPSERSYFDDWSIAPQMCDTVRKQFYISRLEHARNDVAHPGSKLVIVKWRDLCLRSLKPARKIPDQRRAKAARKTFHVICSQCNAPRQSTPRLFWA